MAGNAVRRGNTVGMEWTPSTLTLAWAARKGFGFEPAFSCAYKWRGKTEAERRNLLNEIADRHRLRNSRVFVAVGRCDVFLRCLFNPEADNTPVEKTAAREFPSPLSDLHWLSIGSAGTRLLAAAPVRTMSAIKDALTSVDIRVAGIGFNVPAQLNGLSALGHRLPIDAPYVVLDVGAGEAQISFLNGRQLSYCQSLAFESAAALSKQVSRFHDFAIKASSQKEARSLMLLLRDATHVDDLPELLSRRFDVTVFQNHGWLAAFGQLVSRQDPKAFWFCPPAPSRWDALRRAPRETVLAGAAVGLTMVSLLASNAADKKAAALAVLERRSKQSALSEAATPRTEAAPALLGSFGAVPKNICLIGVQFDASLKRLLVRGRAADYRGVSDYAATLLRTPPFRRVSVEKSELVQIGGRPVVEFSMEASL